MRIRIEDDFDSELENEYMSPPWWQAVWSGVRYALCWPA